MWKLTGQSQDLAEKQDQMQNKKQEVQVVDEHPDWRKSIGIKKPWVSWVQKTKRQDVPMPLSSSWRTHSFPVPERKALLEDGDRSSGLTKASW